MSTPVIGHSSGETTSIHDHFTRAKEHLAALVAAETITTLPDNEQQLFDDHLVALRTLARDLSHTPDHEMLAWLNTGIVEATSSLADALKQRNVHDTTQNQVLHSLDILEHHPTTESIELARLATQRFRGAAQETYAAEVEAAAHGINSEQQRAA